MFNLLAKFRARRARKILGIFHRHLADAHRFPGLINGQLSRETGMQAPDQLKERVNIAVNARSWPLLSGNWLGTRVEIFVGNFVC